MGLLAAANYDPAVAVSKATSALLAMTALDSANLRLSFVAPTSGRVLVRMAGTLHGAATNPSILFGVIESAPTAALVRARFAPAVLWGGAQAATSLVGVESLVPVTGLVSGTTYTWDAAYSVETLVASSAIKYGGPNGTTANDAFGGFVFEVYSG